MTNDELDRLEALAGAATAGPWAARPDRCGVFHTVDDARGCSVLDWHDGPNEPTFRMQADAEFIAAAREAVPALVAEVRRLTKERDEAMALATAMRGVAERAVNKAEELNGLLRRSVAAAERSR